MQPTSEFPLQKAAILALAACGLLFAAVWSLRPDPAGQPYLQFSGGGFVFNYRISEVFYGFTAFVARPLETGSIIEAEFSLGQGRGTAVLRQRVGTETRRYAMRSPALDDVVAGAAYPVKIRVLDRDGAQELWRTERSYVSQISSHGMIGKTPLTIGPGYAPFPANGEEGNGK